MPKKKYAFKCKMDVECMSCWKVVLSENQEYHRKHVHKGENIKFRIYNDSKQQKLQFGGLSNKASESNFNKPSGSSVSTVGNCNNCNEPDKDEISLGDCDSNTVSEEFVRGLSDSVLDSPSSPLLPKNSESHPEANPDVGSSDCDLHLPPPENELNCENEIDCENEKDGENDINCKSKIDGEDDIDCEVNIGREGDIDCNYDINNSDGPNQLKLNQFNPKVYDGFKRDFNSNWYKKFPWINYKTGTCQVSCFALFKKAESLKRVNLLEV